MLQRLLAVTLFTLLPPALSGCTGPTAAPTATSDDMPVHGTFVAAASAADVVVAATVTDDTRTIVDTGGDEANPGVELIATTIEVHEYLAGDGPDDVVVVQETETSTGDNTVLTEGDTVVLALIEQDESSAPAVFAQLGITFTPVSRDYGIAALRDGEVQPFVSGQPATTMSDLRSALAGE